MHLIDHYWVSWLLGLREVGSSQGFKTEFVHFSHSEDFSYYYVTENMSVGQNVFYKSAGTHRLHLLQKVRLRVCLHLKLPFDLFVEGNKPQTIGYFWWSVCVRVCRQSAMWLLGFAETGGPTYMCEVNPWPWNIGQKIAQSRAVYLPDKHTIQDITLCKQSREWETPHTHTFVTMSTGFWFDNIFDHWGK